MTKEDLRLFIKIPTLKTERLILRRINPTDVEDVFDYASCPDVPRYLLWHPHPDRNYTKQYLSFLDKKYKKNEFYDWGIELDGHLIGTCGFSSFDIDNNSAQIGYVLNKKHWGNGYAPEAVKEIMLFGFEVLKLHRIEARFIKQNERSKRVMEKCRMSYEGTLKEAIFAKGIYKDLGIYAITRDEYLKYKTKNMI